VGITLGTGVGGGVISHGILITGKDGIGYGNWAMLS